jgi:hypothetical protein
VPPVVENPYVNIFSLFSGSIYSPVSAILISHDLSLIMADIIIFFICAFSSDLEALIRMLCRICNNA